MGFNKTLLGGLSATALGVAFAVASVGSAQAAYLPPTDVYWENNDTVLAADRMDADVATVSTDDGDFFSLGLGGNAVFGFGTTYTNSNGVVLEVTNGCTGGAGTCSGYPETAKLYAFNDLSFDMDDYVATGGTTGKDFFGDNIYSSFALQWVADIPNAEAQDGFMFQVNNAFTHLVLVDTSAYPPSTDGFDVDMVGVTPLPAAAWFMLTALGGLFGSRWLKGRRGAQQAA